MTKKKDPKDLQKVGRKNILETDSAIVSKLENAFAIGASDSLACSHAGISRETYYKFIREHPEMADRFDQLKKRPILKALNTVVNNLEDPNTAKWYLERKCKDEFSTMQKQEILSANLNVQKVFVTKEEQNEVEKHIEDFINNE